ncbi:MAG TPA: CoA transferase [Dehalococcoidia bacterium]|nr:CoA transferase [Dehalococcoidia bacterium]
MRPLEGIKVLDLSRLAPGPYGTMILADLGADVLEIEPLDWSLPSFLGVEGKSDLLAYHPFERNKRSMCLNLKAEQGRNIFYKLVKNAEVVVEGFRPGVVKRLGVDYETLKGFNPSIIYCSLSGYGQDGSYNMLPGHDLQYLAMGGMLSLIGERGGRPVIPNNFLGDYAGGGLQAAIAILAALVAKDRTGKGQYLDVAMMDGVVLLLAMEASIYFMTGTVPERGDSARMGSAPYYNVYETKDGKYITIGCIEPHFWENLCRALERDDFIPYQHDEGKKKAEIFTALREIFRTRTRDEWFAFLSQKDVCVAPVNTVEEALANPQIIHRGMIDEVNHPQAGVIKQVVTPPKLFGTQDEVIKLHSRPGEHTFDILTELGYHEHDIEELRQAGIVN